MDVTVKDYRNPSYVDVSSNIVDLEIFTEEYGWIPTTIVLDNDDNADHVLEIKAWLNANKATISAYVEPVLTAEELQLQWAQARADAYPPIGDQLDALFHAGVFPAEMAAQIQAVKDKYPKA